MSMGSLEIRFFHGYRAQVGLFDMLFVCCVLCSINYKMEPLTQEIMAELFADSSHGKVIGLNRARNRFLLVWPDYASGERVEESSSPGCLCRDRYDASGRLLSRLQLFDYRKQVNITVPFADCTGDYLRAVFVDGRMVIDGNIYTTILNQPPSPIPQ
jgi:hypothetical protein